MGKERETVMVWTAFFTGLFLGFVGAFLVVGVFLMVRDGR
jgi:tetrahydromethanopterin S-methyltransferase subunit F